MLWAFCLAKRRSVKRYELKLCCSAMSFSRWDHLKKKRSSQPIQIVEILHAPGGSGKYKGAECQHLKMESLVVVSCIPCLINSLAAPRCCLRQSVGIGRERLDIQQQTTNLGEFWNGKTPISQIIPFWNISNSETNGFCEATTISRKPLELSGCWLLGAHPQVHPATFFGVTLAADRFASLYIYMYIIPISLSISLSICLSVWLSICLSVYLSIYGSID
jgi:hypothetical protein